MKIVFYGAQPHIGTSANMSAAVCGLWAFYGIQTTQASDMHQYLKHSNEDWIFFDARGMKGELLQKVLRVSDIIVLNISQTASGLKQFYLDHRMVHSNLLLLVGKYHKNTNYNLIKLGQQYRIDAGRICGIPYNVRFQKAYEDGRILPFIRQELRWTGNYENQQFLKELHRMIQALIKYAAVGRREIYG